MNLKKFCMIGALIGSSIGSYAPALWGGDMLSFSGILLGMVGGFAGIWAGYTLGKRIL
jgi:hypothetical protein